MNALSIVETKMLKATILLCLAVTQCLGALVEADMKDLDLESNLPEVKEKFQLPSKEYALERLEQIMQDILTGKVSFSLQIVKN